MSFPLHIVSPQGRLFDAAAASLVAPGAAGDLGVLTGHAPMIAALRRGVTQITGADGQKTWLVTGQGLIEVTWEGVNLLVDTAQKMESLEAAQAEVRTHLEATGGV